jgi:tetratricopeptide (TPR) repeat protein
MYQFVPLLLLLCAAVHAETALVLPFFNHTKTPALDWIGESISESVRDSLASDGILVLDREDRQEAYRRQSLRPGAELTHASVLKLGESVDASTVIYGFFEVLPDPSNPASKGSLRITARVLDIKRSRQGAPFSEVRALEDLAALETHLGWQVLAVMHPKNVPPERTFMQARPAIRLDAVENYIRGLMATSAEQRHHFFTQAARLDEHYSPPCFQLGKTYWEKKDYKVAAGWLERVARTDPRYFEARFYLGLCRYLSGDVKGAEECFQLVAAELPLNEVYNDLGAAQVQRQSYSDAEANFRKALEGDDTDPDFHFNLGIALWRGGKFTDAAESFRAVLARNASDNEATAMLGRCLKREAARAGDTRSEGKLRLKTNYEESAFRQLQAELAGGKGR